MRALMIDEETSYGVICNQRYAVVFFLNAGTNNVRVSQLYMCFGNPNKCDPCRSIFALITALSVLPEQAYFNRDVAQETESEATPDSSGLEISSDNPDVVHTSSSFFRQMIRLTYPFEGIQWSTV